MVEVDREPEVVGHGAEPRLEVGAAEREPAFQRLGVGVVGPVVARAERVGGLVERDLRRRHAGPPPEVVAHGLAVETLDLLRQVPQLRVRGRHRDAAGVGRPPATEDLQQGGLAGSVGADETDDVAGRDDEVDTGEQLAIAEPGPHVLGLDGCGHAVILLRLSTAGDRRRVRRYAGTHRNARCFRGTTELLDSCDGTARPLPRDTRLCESRRTVAASVPHTDDGRAVHVTCRPPDGSRGTE